jgi:hypothetical protein
MAECKVLKLSHRAQQPPQFHHRHQPQQLRVIKEMLLIICLPQFITTTTTIINQISQSRPTLDQLTATTAIARWICHLVVVIIMSLVVIKWQARLVFARQLHLWISSQHRKLTSPSTSSMIEF